MIMTARAMYSYAAQIPEELGFQKGDILAVLRLQDDGWWEADLWVTLVDLVLCLPTTFSHVERWDYVNELDGQFCVK